MSFTLFFNKPKNELEKGGRQEPMLADENEPSKVCPNCHKGIPLSQIWGNFHTCPCGYHFRMNARQRIGFIADAGSFDELDENLVSENALSFPGYKNKLKMTRNACGEKEAVICGRAEICGKACCLYVMEPYFMMGSMGSAVGEKITRLFEYASEHRLPVVGYTVSGGARMQEGIFSLMQVAKTSGAVKRHSDEGLFYIVVLTDPTTGGVTASFGMEADVILAEPGATIGFAGARVIEQTTRKRLPRGFQKAEFLLEHGFLDMVISRKKLRSCLYRILSMHVKEGKA